MDRKRPRDDEGGEGGGDGGEISMSIEETNKLRISLGLKPLTVGSNKDDQSAKNHQEAKRKKEQEERAEQFKAKLAQKKRQVAQDAFLDVKTLGEADDDDDMQSWVEKTRVADVAKRAEDAFNKRQAEAAAKAKAERGDDDDEEGQQGYSAQDLAGMKVRHGYDDIQEGETMVLTLADRGILDERGRNLVEDGEDELINVLKAEHKAREKARDAAAPKAKPLWEEDGKRRGLLDKYDEEEADIVLHIGQGGTFDAAAHKEEMRRKLAEGGKMLDSAAVGMLAEPVKPGAAAAAAGAGAGTAGEYYTEAEMAGFKKRDKKQKKERKLRSKPEPEQETDTAALVEQLEASAAQGAGGPAAGGGAGDLGSRSARATLRERTEAALREESAAKREKFEAAVAKGNWASQALRPQAPGAATQQAELVIGDDDDADRELQESLARARRLAAKSEVKSEGQAAGGEAGRSTLELIAESMAKARDADEARLKEELAAAKLGKDRVVNDTMEFVRNIQAAPAPTGGFSVLPGGASTATGSRLPPPPPPPPDAGGDGGDDDDEGYMDIDDEAAPGWTNQGEGGRPGGDGEGGPVRQRQYRKNAAAAAAAAGAGGDTEMRGSEEGGSGEESEPEDSGVGEKGLGRGLASALAMLKDRGNLNTEKTITWAGRTNDRSKNALQGLIGDVYAGGGHEDRLARSIESALTTKDEFGRVMTPKERFRQLCYDFHGKRPSKNKEATRLKKAAEEIERRKNATSEVADHQEGMKQVTEKVAQPFVVLQGKGAMESLKAIKGSMAPPPPKHKSKGHKIPPPPGNLTPLLGDKKVEAMLGITKPPMGGSTSTARS